MRKKELGLKVMMEDTPHEAHHRLYNKILKKLTFTYGLHPKYSERFFKYCADQNRYKAEVFMKQEFKKSVRESKKQRNEYQCAICGGVDDLTFHHKKRKKDYPELEFDKKNIELVCENCHKRLHVLFDGKHNMDFDDVRMKMLGLTPTQRENLNTGIEFESNHTFTVKGSVSITSNDKDKLRNGEVIQLEFLNGVPPFDVGDIVQVNYLDDSNQLHGNDFVVVADKNVKPFKLLNSLDAVSSGYESLGHYREYLQKMYPNLKGDTELGLIVFTLINT